MTKQQAEPKKARKAKGTKAKRAKSRAHTASRRLFIKEKPSEKAKPSQKQKKASIASDKAAPKKSQTKRAKNEIYTQKKDKL